MRLGICIALELAVAASCVGGVWVGVGQALAHAGDVLDLRPAAAASQLTVATNAAPVFEPMPVATLDVTPPPAIVAIDVTPESVYGSSDAELLAPIGESAVTKIKVNRGGTSLSLRLDFASGARCAFKPEQIYRQSDPRKEIAAYRIDRLLGIGRVPPAKSITLPITALVAAAEAGKRGIIAGRLADEAIARRSVLHGVASWWIPEIKIGRVAGVQIDDIEGLKAWTRLLKVGAKIPETDRAMLAQLSALALFDVLIDNPDRWSGGNTRMSPDGRTLYFMDNALSFSRFSVGHLQNLDVMRRIEVFPRGLVEKLRALTLASVTAAVLRGEDDGLAPLIGDRELAAIMHRRDNMVRYIDLLIAKYGEAAVLALP